MAQATDAYSPLGTVYPRTSGGRRTALARWIGSRRNPLTARVAVNHLWKRHFGKAIVPAVANFGLRGEVPTHSELLDWLAVGFMESGWSMKHLHRLMVTTNTYRLRSRSANSTTVHQEDPDLHHVPGLYLQNRQTRPNSAFLALAARAKPFS